MDETTLAERRPVWLALSDLFLDTDVRLFYASIARALADSAYAPEEWRHIFREEVAPVLTENLSSMAGEWAGFGAEWLESEILAHMATPRGLKVPPPAGTWADFTAVAGLAGMLRTLPRAERPRRAALWNTLSTLLLNRSSPLPEDWPPPEPPDELSSIFQTQILPTYGVQIEAYRKHSPRTYPDRAEVDAAWAAWLAEAKRKRPAP